MGNNQARIATGNCTTNLINVSFTKPFRIQPSIAYTPICKYGDLFTLKISEVDRYGFRFKCLKLDGTEITKHRDFFQWVAIGE